MASLFETCPVPTCLEEGSLSARSTLFPTSLMSWGTGAAAVALLFSDLGGSREAQCAHSEGERRWD